MKKGLIPHNWKVRKLGDISSIRSGGTPSRTESSYWKDGIIPWVKISDINNMLVKSTSECITEEGLKNSSAKILNRGDIIYTIFATLGEVAILDIDAATNQAIAGIEINEDIVNKKYLYYFLKSVKEAIISKGRGVAQNNINLSILKSINVFIPPLEEQKKIASILEKVENAVRKRKEADELADKYLQSVFIEMFGEPVTNPMGWESKLLGDICNKITDGTHKTPVYMNEGVKFISAKNIINNVIDWDNTKYISTNEHKALTKRCNPEMGDILLTKSGSIGDAAIIDSNVEFSIFESLALIKYNSDKIVGKYLLFYLNSQFAKNFYLKSSKGISIRHLHLNELRKIRIFMPPIELQNEFADIVQKVETLKQKQNQSAEELDTLFKSLMQKAFRGELTNSEIIEEDLTNDEEFNLHNFKRHINAKFGDKYFRFEELLASLKEHYESITYEEVKDNLYKALEKSSENDIPFLVQTLKNIDFLTPLELQDKSIYYTTL